MAELDRELELFPDDFGDITDDYNEDIANEFGEDPSFSDEEDLFTDELDSLADEPELVVDDKKTKKSKKKPVRTVSEQDTYSAYSSENRDEIVYSNHESGYTTQSEPSYTESHQDISPQKASGETYSYLVTGLEANQGQSSLPLQDYILSGQALSWSHLEQQDPWLTKLMADEKAWTYQESDRSWSTSYPVSESAGFGDNAWHVLVKSDVSWHEEMQSRIRDQILSDTSGSIADEAFKDYYEMYGDQMPYEYDNIDDGPDPVNEYMYAETGGSSVETYGTGDYDINEALAERIDISESDKALRDEILQNTPYEEQDNLFGTEHKTIIPDAATVTNKSGETVAYKDQLAGNGLKIEYDSGIPITADHVFREHANINQLNGAANEVFGSIKGIVIQQDYSNVNSYDEQQIQQAKQMGSAVGHTIQDMLASVGASAAASVALYSMEQQAEATKWLLDAAKEMNVDVSKIVSVAPDTLDIDSISGIISRNTATNVNSFFAMQENGAFDTAGLNNFINDYKAAHDQKLTPFMFHEIRGAAQGIASDLGFREIVNQNANLFANDPAGQKMVDYVNSDDYLKHTNLAYEAKLLDEVVVADTSRLLIKPELDKVNDAISTRINALTSEQRAYDALKTEQAKEASKVFARDIDLLNKARLSTDLSTLENLKARVTDGRSHELLNQKIFMLRVDQINNIDELKAMLPNLSDARRTLVEKKITNLQISRTNDIKDLRSLLKDPKVTLHQKQLINAKIRNIQRRNTLSSAKSILGSLKGLASVIIVSSLTSSGDLGQLTRAIGMVNKVKRMKRLAKDVHSYMISVRSRISPKFASKMAQQRVMKANRLAWKREHSLSGRALKGMNKVNDAVAKGLRSGVSAVGRGISAPIRGVGKAIGRTAPMQKLATNTSMLKGRVDTIRASLKNSGVGKAAGKLRRGGKVVGRAAGKAGNVLTRIVGAPLKLLRSIFSIVNKIKILLIVALIHVVVLWMGFMMIVIIFQYFGSSVVMVTNIFDDGDGLGIAIDGYYGMKGVKKLEKERYEDAYELATGKPITDSVAFWEHIEKYGHPENTDGVNTEEEYRGWEIYYVSEDDETIPDKEKEKLQIGQTNIREIVAMASVMFGNDINIINNYSFGTLVQDLWYMTHPDMRYEESEMYVNEYMGDSTYEYFCPQHHHYDNFVTIEQQGGKVYGTPVPKTDYGCEIDYDAYNTAHAQWQNSEPSLYDEKYLDRANYDWDYNYWRDNPPKYEDYVDYVAYNKAIDDWNSWMPEISYYYSYEAYLAAWNTWYGQKPDPSNYPDYNAYNNAWEQWANNPPNVEDYRDRNRWQTDHNNWQNSEPKPEDFRYCPGHEIQVCYGHRAIEIYLPVISMEEVFERNLYPGGWDQFWGVYDVNVRDFVESGGWENEENREQARILASSDLFSTYAIDLITHEQAPAGVEYTTAEQNKIINNIDYTGVSVKSKRVAQFVTSMIGKVPYSEGVKALSKNINECKFGQPVSDSGGKIYGLSSENFIEWAYWNATNDKSYLGPFSIDFDEETGEELEIFNGHGKRIKHSELKPGDIGVDTDMKYYVNVAGIYVGKDEDGNDVWVYMSPIEKEVIMESTNTFNYYFRVD